MPFEILTPAQRAEWERFPEEIDEASLTAFFAFADDELERIAAHRDIHGRFAIAAAAAALRWLGFVPATLDELPEPAAALIAAQLDIALSSIAPARPNAERDARASHIAQAVARSARAGTEISPRCGYGLPVARLVMTGRWRCCEALLTGCAASGWCARG
jgi:hypothetical protein